MSLGGGGRDEMFRHLERELVGPAVGRELGVDELPTGRYAAGILYPVATEFGDEPAAFTGSDDDPVSQTTKYYPSACGLSFVLPRGGDITVRLGAAAYCCRPRCLVMIRQDWVGT